MAGVEKINSRTMVDKIRELLKDGERHTKKEIREVCGCTSVGVIFIHIINLRKTLPEDEDILCELVGRTIGYRHVKLFCKRTKRLKHMSQKETEAEV